MSSIIHTVAAVCCSSATDGFQFYMPHADKQKMYLFLAGDMVVFLVSGIVRSN
jgi:hypothetical protein